MAFHKSLLLGLGIMNLSPVVSKAMEQLKLADSIQVEQEEDTERQKNLAKKKCDEYERLTNSNDPNVSVQALFRVALIHHAGFCGIEPDKGKAIPYWRALTNQTTSRSLRAQAFEMLGIYAVESRKYGLITLEYPKEYFIRARDESPLEDKDIKERAIAQLNNLKALK
jgi:hypothetical protein